MAGSMEQMVDGGVCHGCGETIVDRFYLYALDQQWHNSCLRCCVCSRELESEGSCYVKDGFIYCKEDYLQRFGMQKCARCSSNILSGELVMRAQSQVYHVTCFSCAACSTALKTGDHFGVWDDKIFCRLHYEQMQYNTLNNNGLLAHDDTYNVDSSTPYIPPVSHTDFNREEVTSPSSGQVKGRQRKNRNHQKSNHLEQWPMGVTMIDPDTGYPNGQPPIKQKRMRTSFKHHQLRIMKQYFGLNHNPDAKDLKQLSQKTNLNKRVLQVWFQNARAKFRRGLTGKDGNPIEGSESPTQEDNTGDQNSNESVSDEEQQDLNDLESSSVSTRSLQDELLQQNSPPQPQDSLGFTQQSESSIPPMCP